MKKVGDNWCKCVKIAMILKEINTEDLAQGLGYTRHFIAGIINGYRNSPIARKRICKYLEVNEEVSREALEVIREALEKDCKEKSM